ncbi:MAG: hypothetical protein HZB72_09115 [Burkholderiales bacterium]|nr:hypothetical protein [Burkholderiales bacterium]
MGWLLKLRALPWAAYAWSLATVVAVAALVWLIYLLGRLDERAIQATAHAQRTQEAVQAALREQAASLARGAADVAALRQERDQLQRRYTDLQRRLAHVPKLSPTPGCTDPAGVRLTAGAVRLWNAALGHPDVPAGACGAYGPAAGAGAADRDAACSQPSGITLEQAGDNAQRNFSTCAAIRAQCQALISNLQRERALSTQQLTETP